MKRMFVVLVTMMILLVGVANFTAQSQSLSQTQNNTTVDGEIQDQEYSYSESFNRNRFNLHLNWKGDRLFVAVDAKTKGWVAVGFNSKVMNDAEIIIGYMDGRNQVVRTDLGRGHSHRETDMPSKIAHALSESDGVTYMELELDTTTLFGGGQTSLDMIFAYGTRDSFTSPHRFRDQTTIELK